MATEEITISELELADEVLADMTLPVDTATDTKAVTLKQLKAWLGSSLPTGFIIPAVGKINDERFTLLDGKTLSRIGTYGAFCNKVVEQVQAGNWFACTEEEYASDISQYGQCGRFVVSNDYVRIPTITRFVGATITLSEIGKTYAESLPNIKGLITSNNWAGTASGTSALYPSGSGQNSEPYGTGANAIGFDASRSSKVYKDGAKVQPDHTKYPYYMVVSSEGQTEEINVDINKIYEDLELKANKNLSNLTSEGKSLASGFGMPSDKSVNLTLGSSGSTYTAPANGYVFFSKASNAAGQYINLTSGSYGMQVYSAASGQVLKVTLPVLKGRTYNVQYTLAGTTTSYFRFVYAEGDK